MNVQLGIFSADLLILVVLRIAFIVLML